MQILFKAISGQVKEVIWNSQCGFTMGNSCFSNFIALWDEMKRYVDDGRLVNTIIHYFMVIVFQIIPVSILGH